MDLMERIRAAGLSYHQHTLSESQVWVLTLVTLFSSYVSMVGSFWVLGILSREKEWFAFERIMAYSRICIILQGLGLCLAPFIPPIEMGRGLAFGNEGTCDAGGFLMQVGFSVPLYSASLSVYYFLRVCYHMDKLKIAQKYEWALHLFPLVFPYSTAVVGLIGGVYQEVDFGLGCWVSGRMNLLWVCIFLGFPFVVTVKIVAGCTLSVVLAAKKYLKQNAPKEPARLYPVDITKADPKKVQEDAMQCQLYSASCIFCISWMMALRMLDEGPAGDRSQEGNYYWLILMAHLSYPLKGFLDFFIFLRPAVIEKRRYDPSLTKIMALRAVLFLGSRQRDGSVDLSSQQSQGTKQQNSNVESFVHEVDGFDDSLDGFSAVSLASRSTATQRTRRGSQTPNNGQGKVNRFKRAFSDDHVVGDGDVHGPDWLD